MAPTENGQGYLGGLQEVERDQGSRHLPLLPLRETDRNPVTPQQGGAGDRDHRPAGDHPLPHRSTFSLRIPEPQMCLKEVNII